MNVPTNTKTQCDERRNACGPCVKRDIKCGFQDAIITATIDLASLPPSQLTIKFDRRSTRPAKEFAPKKDRPNKKQKRNHKPPYPEQAQPHCGDFIDCTAPVLSLDIFYPDTHSYLTNTERHLLHHYFMNTSNTITLKGPMERHLVDLVPGCVQSHDYIVYGLLSMSALHLAFLHFSHSGDRSTCVKYHNMGVENMCKGISKFRTSETNLHAGNMKAVFAFSGLSLILELALMADIVYGGKNHKEHEVDRFVRLAQLVRNVSGLWLSFPLSFYWKMNGKEVEWHEMIRAGTSVDTQEEFEQEVCQIRKLDDIIPEISSTMSWLHDLNNIFTPADSLEERELYTQAINSLHMSFHHFTTNPDDWVVVLRCMNKSSSFTHLVQQRKPFALVILAHYCVLIHHGPGAKLWWMRNWGQSMLQAIFDELDDTWKTHLAWAMDAIKPGRMSLTCVSTI